MGSNRLPEPHVWYKLQMMSIILQADTDACDDAGITLVCTLYILGIANRPQIPFIPHVCDVCLKLEIVERNKVNHCYSWLLLPMTQDSMCVWPIHVI